MTTTEITQALEISTHPGNPSPQISIPPEQVWSLLDLWQQQAFLRTLVRICCSINQDQEKLEQNHE